MMARVVVLEIFTVQISRRSPGSVDVPTKSRRVPRKSGLFTSLFGVRVKHVSVHVSFLPNLAGCHSPLSRMQLLLLLTSTRMTLRIKSKGSMVHEGGQLCQVPKRRTKNQKSQKAQSPRSESNSRPAATYESCTTGTAHRAMLSGSRTLYHWATRSFEPSKLCASVRELLGGLSLELIKSIEGPLNSRPLGGVRYILVVSASWLYDYRHSQTSP